MHAAMLSSPKRRISCSLLSLLALASCDRWAGDLVRVEVVVDVGSVTGVGRLDVPGNLGSRREGLGATASDLDLSARDVELRGRAGVVDAELFDAEQVLASSDARGDSDGVVVYVNVSQGTVQTITKMKPTLQVPRSLATRESGANLLDLDPVARTIRAGCAADLGQVEGNRSLVVDSLIGCKSDRGASSDRDSGG